jgi:hypothetical protein
MIHQQSSHNAIMEVREDYITSPVGHRQPTYRIAHFLKPIAKSTHELILNELKCLTLTHFLHLLLLVLFLSQRKGLLKSITMGGATNHS